MRSRLLAAVVVAGVVATGCTNKEKSDEPAVVGGASATIRVPESAAGTAPPAREPTPSASATPAPSNDPTAAKALTALAKRSAAAAYDASYDFAARGTRGVIRIVADPPFYRVDLSAGPARVQFYDIAVGRVSCGLAQGKPPSCALVAKPGEKVPDAFNPGVQELFINGVDALAKKPDGFAISPLPAASPAAGVPVGTCFHVERLADLEPVSPGTVTPPGEGFESGDYCFDPATAVLTSVRVATGTLRLRKAPTEPVDADFTPPATPMPLAPSASPTP
ncbi:MAG: hypothetical protein ABIM89_12930 [Mycobacteriales bacterium]